MSATRTDSTLASPTSSKGLAGGRLGLLSSVFIGVSSTAPAYSLAATLGFIVVAVGTKAPLALILAFVPMFFVAIAYRELNNDDPDCGTTFTWAKKAFGRRVGWMGGWALALSGIIVLANLAQISGQYLWLLINPELAESTGLVTLTGLVFILVMTAVNYRGIDLGARMQQVFLLVQYAALAVIAFAAIAKLVTNPPETAGFSWDWFSPVGAAPSDMIYAVLLGLFIYWGWDSCLALNEETKNPRKTPGQAAVFSSLVLLVTYVGLSTLVLMLFGDGVEGLGLGNEANAADVFHAASTYLLGDWSWIVVVGVMVSAVASTQTTILPTARGTLAMATHQALPAAFGRVHPKHQTPGFSTVVMGVAASIYFVVMSLVSSNFLEDSIASIGLFIAFYYAVTAAACVWSFRKTLSTPALVVNRFVLPALGALAMAGAFVFSAVDMLSPDYGSTVIFGLGGAFVIGIGLILTGIPLMAWQYRKTR